MCKWEAMNASECAMFRERSVAGTSNILPRCFEHDGNRDVSLRAKARRDVRRDGTLTVKAQRTLCQGCGHARGWHGPMGEGYCRARQGSMRVQGFTGPCDCRAFIAKGEAS